MIDTYFFVPADKKKYLDKISEISSDYYVLDFEDAVSANKKIVAFENVRDIEISKKTFFRIPLLEDHFSQTQIDSLVEKCEGRIVIPKINSVDELEKTLNVLNTNDLSLILLIETPRCYINLKNILVRYSNVIFGIGFGSHDFCSIMGMKHELDLLKTYKFELNTLAKSFDIKFIDGVDIDLVNFDNFEKECLFAFNIGADGKFMIYPKQLEVAQSLEYMTKDEISTIRKVSKEIEKMNMKDVDILKLDGKIYEKPHINRIVKLNNKISKIT